MHRARQVEWDFIIFFFHTNHVLQPFDATYFVPFKTTFVVGMRSFKKPLQEAPTFNKNLIGDQHELMMEKT